MLVPVFLTELLKDIVPEKFLVMFLFKAHPSAHAHTCVWIVCDLPFLFFNKIIKEIPSALIFSRVADSWGGEDSSFCSLSMRNVLQSLILHEETLEDLITDCNFWWQCWFYSHAFLQDVWNYLEWWIKTNFVLRFYRMKDLNETWKFMKLFLTKELCIIFFDKTLII